MAITKRSKSSRMRGSKTHGGGAMKKRRGAGHRGGRGAAGSGKRGDAKKPSIWKAYPNIGKTGFTSHSRTGNAPITINHLETHLNTLLKAGIVVLKNKQYVADLTKAGFTKLLGTGTPTNVWVITVPAATPGAIEKIKKANGSVTVNSQEKAAEEKPVTKE